MLPLVHQEVRLGKSPLFLLFLNIRVNNQIPHPKEVNQILRVRREARLKRLLKGIKVVDSSSDTGTNVRGTSGRVLLLQMSS